MSISRKFKRTFMGTMANPWKINSYKNKEELKIQLKKFISEKTGANENDINIIKVTDMKGNSGTAKVEYSVKVIVSQDSFGYIEDGVKQPIFQMQLLIEMPKTVSFRWYRN